MILVRKIRAFSILLVGLVAGSSLFSCAVGADAQVQADGRMNISVLVDINPVFQAYLKDLAGEEVDAKGGFFDLQRIRTRMESAGGLVVKDLKKLSANQLQAKLEIPDTSRLLVKEGKDVQGMVSIAKKGGDTVLTLRLNRQVMKSVMAIAASEAGDQADYLLPKKDGISADEYRKNLDWALEDYGTKAQRGAMFDAARVNLNIQLPRAIKSAKGFVIADKAKGTLTLKLSLIDLMVIQEEKIFEAVY